MVPNGPETREQRTLRLSLLVTLAIAAITLVVGLRLGSRAITFDGVYELIDASMTGVALVAARLIVRGDDRRFQYGYWHLEPMLALLNGAAMASACAYAFLDGLGGLLAGGRQVPFGPAAIAAGAFGTAGLVMAAVVGRAAKATGSQLLSVDARSWAMASAISGALVVGFGGGALLGGSPWPQLAPYVDPLILMLVALCLLPVPARLIRHAGREVLMIAPPELDLRVRDVAAGVAARHGFHAYDSHVSRSGRQQFVEIGLVADADAPARRFADLDAIREEIAAALGEPGPGTWLTVDFTADARWI